MATAAARLGLIALEQIVEVVFREEVDAGGWFVEQNDVWPTDYRSGQKGPLQLAARKPRERSLRQARSTNQIEGLTCQLSFSSGGPSGPAAPQARHHQIAGEGRKAAIEGLELRYVADPFRGDASMVPEDGSVASLRFDESERDLEERRFAGTVGSNHRQKVPWLEVERDIAQDLGVAIAHGDAVDVEGWGLQGTLLTAVLELKGSGDHGGIVAQQLLVAVEPLGAP